MSLRTAMPLVAAFIDELRAEFGGKEINEQIRRGMHGQTTFYAKEGGQEIGRRDLREGVPVTITKPVVIALGKAARGR